MNTSRSQHRRLLFALVTAIGCLASSSARAEIYTVFADTGVPGSPSGFNPIDTFSGSPPNVVIYTTAPFAGSPEGFSCFQTTQPQIPYAGWGIAFAGPKDLSRFNQGEFRFWVYSSTGDVEVQLQNQDGSQGLLMDTTLTLLNWDWTTMHDQWVFMRIALSAVNLSSVQHPGVFVLNRGPGHFYIDNVHFVDSTAMPNFAVTPRNRSNDASTSNITWSQAASTWTLADQYIALDADADVLSWGVQLYTNNTATNANPRYTGQISSFTPTPSGLINTTDTTSKINIAWAMRPSISTIPVVAADPNGGSPDSFQWFIVEDKAQVAVKSLNASDFLNGDPYITVENNVGIHFTQGPNLPNGPFGPAFPPTRIYLEADLGSALAQQTYQTNQLIVELFYL